MCGIAGIVALRDGGSPDPGLLAHMSERLVHRGPDGSGKYAGDRVALAHRRLAIIDLSEDARQPIANEDGTLILVYNGEIYNYIELREDLTGKGHGFRSHSDSEVILHAYEEWGTECLTRFNGMWAFALWDGKKGELFCARDRFGIKPFYYAEADGMFFFASEIKALLCHPGVGRTPDEETLLTYLAWGVQDHSPRTMFGGVLQLPPSHFLIVNAAGVQKPGQYWDVTVNPAPFSQMGSEEEEAARFRELLTDAVRIHLRSDVPVGTCLSGGIDSTTLTVLINQLIRKEALKSVGERQNTFSSCFADNRFDESSYIDEVIGTTGVSAHRVFPDPGQLWDDVRHLVEMQDEPFSSLSIYAQYCVMRLAASRVKVVLDGQGADEQLAGYLAYQSCFLRGLLRKGHLLAALRELSGSIRHHRTFFLDALVQLRVRKGRRRLLRGQAPDLFRYRGSLDQVLKRELIATNLPALLHYEDRNSMAFSIESRVPYLDYRLVGYIASLPLDRKIRGGITKFILRKAIKGLVPERIRCRMDKMGYVTPEEVWMKEELRPFVLEILSSPEFKARKYWDADAVARNYLDYLSGRTAYSSDLWRILCTELWLRIFFDKREA
jgi:asparagine synthase (glutamine-hydrolysing)